MRVIVEITSDPGSGEKIRLNSGQTISVGRTTRADHALPHDTYLSGVHFALECTDDMCLLRDLNSSNGTFVKGKRVNEARLHEGDEFTAGHTNFTVHIEADAGASLPTGVAEFPGVAEPQASAALAQSADAIPQEAAPPHLARLLQILRGQPEPLFALLDAARDPRVLELLRASEAEYQSLYEGEKGRELDDYAPYLVNLPLQSKALETLAREGWGESWGLFLTSDRPFAKVRRYLRQFLLVKDERGRELYFRFYDPRVMRVYLPTCDAVEAGRMFGPISRYLVEADKHDALLQFTASEQGAAQQRLPLTGGGGRVESSGTISYVNQE